MGGRRFSLSWKQQAFILSVWLLNAGMNFAVTWENHTGLGVLCSASPSIPSGGRGWTEEKGQELLKCNSLSDTRFVLVLNCFCACRCLDWYPDWHKNHVAAREKRGMYRLSCWWAIGAWVWVSFGSRCAVPNLHPGAAVLQQPHWPEAVLTESYSLPVPLLIPVLFCTELTPSTNKLKRNTQKHFLEIQFTEPNAITKIRPETVLNSSL